MAAGRRDFVHVSVRGEEVRGAVGASGRSATQTDPHFKPGEADAVPAAMQGDRRAGRGRGAELQSVSTENQQSR